jgi:hypothetical protein
LRGRSWPIAASRFRRRRAWSSPADYRPAALKPTEVRLTFVGHSTWLIESAAAVRIATDYNDYVRPQVVPEIATMNRAHTTHYSNFPDPGIRHVLKGWSNDAARPGTT